MEGSHATRDNDIYEVSSFLGLKKMFITNAYISGLLQTFPMSRLSLNIIDFTILVVVYDDISINLGIKPTPVTNKCNCYGLTTSRDLLAADGIPAFA